jgi:septal ring factor EnvC (AmiA/AmiB activator)
VDGSEKLEARIAEIAAAIVAAGEARYRLSVAERLAHRARMEAYREECRQQAIAKRNKERLAALHRSAELLRIAQDLRAVIASVSAAIAAGRRELDPDVLAEWRHWAEAEADRIDPVISGQVDEHLYPEPSGSGVPR